MRKPSADVMMRVLATTTAALTKKLCVLLSRRVWVSAVCTTPKHARVIMIVVSTVTVVSTRPVCVS